MAIDTCISDFVGWRCICSLPRPRGISCHDLHGLSMDRGVFQRFEPSRFKGEDDNSVLQITIIRLEGLIKNNVMHAHLDTESDNG